MTRENLQLLCERLIGGRIRLLSKYGFFGCLLMNMSLGIQSCATAYTDMKRVVFDPEFLNRLSDDELDFVLLHEVLHCALSHCLRGKGLEHHLYNIACDIVVNSHIMSVMGMTEFQVDGDEVMHLTPEGREGCEYTAEEVYELLRKQLEDAGCPVGMFGDTVDEHDGWDKIQDPFLQDQWREQISRAASGANKDSGNIPGTLKRLMDEIITLPPRNWKEWLQEFIQTDSCDYSFQPPDRRYAYTDYVLPGFSEAGAKLEEIWICVDVSGSINDRELKEMLGEIAGMIEQMEYFSGKISFFDWDISKPEAFQGIEELWKMNPSGGGGTSFHCIFRLLAEWEGDFPKLIMIITDGYAAYPQESMALGIPVFWLVKGKDVTPPWGIVGRF